MESAQIDDDTSSTPIIQTSIGIKSNSAHFHGPVINNVGRTGHQNYSPPDGVPHQHPIWFNVEEPTSHFHGRDQILEELREKTQNQNLTVLTGLSGIGKSETVRKYISRHFHQNPQQNAHHQNIIWIDAWDEPAIQNSFIKLSIFLGLPSSSFKKFGDNDGYHHVAENVYLKICRWATLIIFDGPDDLHTIKPYLPSCQPSQFFKTPTILVTSPCQSWMSSLKKDQIIHLSPLSDAECVDFILGQLELDLVDDDHRGMAHQLGNLMDRIPLAVQQAVDFIRFERDKARVVNQNFGILDYLRGYEEEKCRKKYLNFRHPESSSSKKTIFDTWKTMLDKIQSPHDNEEGGGGKMAVKIFEKLSFLHPNDHIPRDFLMTFLLVEKEGQQLLQNVQEGLIVLKKFCLIHASPDWSILRVRQIVQDVVLEIMNEKGDLTKVYLEVVRHLDQLDPKKEAAFLKTKENINKIVQRFTSLQSKMVESSASQFHHEEEMREIISKFPVPEKELLFYHQRATDLCPPGDPEWVMRKKFKNFYTNLINKYYMSCLEPTQPYTSSCPAIGIHFGRYTCRIGIFLNGSVEVIPRTPNFLTGDEIRRPADLTAGLFSKLKQVAEIHLTTKRRGSESGGIVMVNNVVITVPQFSDECQRRVIQEAAKKGGFLIVNLINCAQAAVFARLPMLCDILITNDNGGSSSSGPMFFLVVHVSQKCGDVTLVKIKSLSFPSIFQSDNDEGLNILDSRNVIDYGDGDSGNGDQRFFQSLVDVTGQALDEAHVPKSQVSEVIMLGKRGRSDKLLGMIQNFLNCPPIKVDQYFELWQTEVRGAAIKAAAVRLAELH